MLAQHRWLKEPKIDDALTSRQCRSRAFFSMQTRLDVRGMHLECVAIMDHARQRNMTWSCSKAASQMCSLLEVLCFDRLTYRIDKKLFQQKVAPTFSAARTALLVILSSLDMYGRLLMAKVPPRLW